MVQYGYRGCDSTKTGRRLEKSGRAYTGPFLLHSFDSMSVVALFFIIKQLSRLAR
jgi:hypothetical protein